MKNDTGITCLFLDIGGVLLTDGWSHQSRKLASKVFGLDHKEMENRHAQVFDTYELGKLTINDYLKHVVFFEKRSFTPAKFQKFMFDRSKPLPRMIEAVTRLKAQYRIKIVAVSNEARELNEYRIQEYQLGAFIDFFISSCYVHLRKPDEDIFRLALDVAHVPLRQIVYIENTAMFVSIAESLGIRSILHRDSISTLASLASLGLNRDKAF